jgi:hypothetical protein
MAMRQQNDIQETRQPFTRRPRGEKYGTTNYPLAHGGTKTFAGCDVSWPADLSSITSMRNPPCLEQVIQFYSGDSGTTWHQYANTRIAPVGTRTVWIRMQATIDLGSAINAYFDDVSLLRSPAFP